MCNSKKKWYAIQAFSGYENTVAQSIQEYVQTHHITKEFGKILVPSEEVIEIKKGQRKKSEYKFFPGYILIHMIMNNTNWHIIRNLPKVTGFVGGAPDKPTPINKKEIKKILEKLKKIDNKPRPKIIFEPGETIRVKEGPFADFNGIVETIDYEKNRLKVSVSIFGRSTPVELDFSQVIKN
ncbi:transcription termination/antitermination protein NusG [Buchnera aphidicola]|uniref:Transcription termination/antitermination protein NusG n=1 Tax=Buchnera aphidicola subsp. Tuberolachnus salignus TaxID=98804 RepID=A0A160SXU7_BUCTT|nr:transcription termination/antitermination protein NusG [Buchnera aphidicola]CUR53014.1 Transcription termination/antitermination protein NusG [Buchnera aphidicola (Tuberolachnus salignus)]